jgi:hypothetical protein
MVKWKGGARRLGVVVTAAILTAAAGSFGSQRVSAITTYCRSDPAIVLTNGATIDLSASIGDSLSDVQQVQYVVHAPAGTHLLAVVNTDGLMGPKETVKLYADNSYGTYDSATTVLTGQKNVAVTASTDIVSALDLSLGLRSASGYSGTPVAIRVKTLL